MSKNGQDNILNWETAGQSKPNFERLRKRGNYSKTFLVGQVGVNKIGRKKVVYNDFITTI